MEIVSVALEVDATILRRRRRADLEACSNLVAHVIQIQQIGLNTKMKRSRRNSLDNSMTEFKSGTRAALRR